MKRLENLGKSLFVIVCLIAFYGIVANAIETTSGTATTSREGRWDVQLANKEWENNMLECRTFNLTSNSAGEVLVTITEISGELLRVVTNPGDTAPDDNWDLVLTDRDGIDVLGGNGVDRDTANSENIAPYLSDGTTTRPYTTFGPIDLTGSTMGGVKDVVVRVYFRR